ncbi:MAG: hypothetical protein LUH54_01620, partial [Firmicutes bacterium]|nr:hypothetical protein [Bacillota bacterium]
MAKGRKPISPFAVIAVIALIAALAVAAVFLGFYMSGYRYIRVPYDVVDGETEYIKFLGRVNEAGEPYTGNITYPDGLAATIDLETNCITYSNGDVYVGDIEDLQRNGTGKLTYNSGDVY